MLRRGLGHSLGSRGLLLFPILAAIPLLVPPFPGPPLSLPDRKLGTATGDTHEGPDVSEKNMAVVQQRHVLQAGTGNAPPPRQVCTGGEGGDFLCFAPGKGGFRCLRPVVAGLKLSAASSGSLEWNLEETFFFLGLGVCEGEVSGEGVRGSWTQSVGHSGKGTSGEQKQRYLWGTKAKDRDS